MQLFWFATALLFALLTVAVPGRAQDTDPYIRSERLGITFISSADLPTDDNRYRQALFLGAGWNRFPVYWQAVERSPGNYDWREYDRVIAADIEYGLQTNAILLGIPEFHRAGGSIAGLDAPVFSDGSDSPGPGKAINPANPWANFVYAAVNRYRPGGIFGADGVRVWEAWNEPDFRIFWEGGVNQYARLLKVTYLAAHHADPDAEVMFGGLAYVDPARDDWLLRTLQIIASDPARAQHNWYFDIMAVHNYSNAGRSGWIVRHANEILARFGLERPIWLNESGVPAWDDYPGPTWTASLPDQRRLRATQQQQANFIVQSTTHAWAAGAQVVFYHQLYDDCGNQPAGTNFPPHSGERCTADGICAGDAHGLFRNTRDNICFSQHPQPGTARPAAAAFRVLAEVFGDVTITGSTVLSQGERATVIVFDTADRQQRIFALWNRSLEQITLDLPASGAGADLYTVTNQDFYIVPENGVYTIGLPAATRDDYPFLAPGEVSAIGGPPFLLVETLAGAAEVAFNPALVNLQPYDPERGNTLGVAGFGLPVGERIQLTPGPIISGGDADAASPVTPAPTVPPTDAPPTRTPLAAPTIDPASDTTPPVPTFGPLPVISPPTFTLVWGAQDNSSIAAYTVWVRANGGDWQVLLEDTTATQTQFSGDPGTTYEFAVWARDLAGNWSANVDLQPMARTAVQG